MKNKFDVENWARKDHFNFFNKFEEPFYGICTDVDCTAAYQISKENNHSFFLYYLYQALVACQHIEAFKLRVEGDEVYLYHRIDAGSTISRPDGTFGFGDFIYRDNFTDFYAGALKVMQRVQQEKGLTLSAASNVIRCSALPWIDFTSLSHARMFTFKDSCPKISFGQMKEVAGRKTMPVSIHVHHALIDGLQLGQYISLYRELMSSKISG